MRFRFVQILYLAAAALLLSGCSPRDVSGTYIAKFTNGIYWMQLVETPDKHLTGQFVTLLVLGTDGKVQHNNLSISGAVDGDNISVLFLPLNVPASGTFNGGKLTLTGGFTGERPNTIVFVPSDAGEYEAQAKALNEQSQRILTAKAHAEALEKMGQIVSRMEHFSADVNAQLDKPWVEKRYHDITAQMQEYLKAQRQLANNSGASFKRNQISFAIGQGVFATEQVHFRVQSDQGYFTANAEPLMKQATEAERVCQLARNSTSDNSPSTEAQVNNSTCLKLLNAFPIFKRTYDAKAGSLAHLEDVYRQERQQQKQLQLESQQIR